MTGIPPREEPRRGLLGALTRGQEPPPPPDSLLSFLPQDQRWDVPKTTEVDVNLAEMLGEIIRNQALANELAPQRPLSMGRHETARMVKMMLADIDQTIAQRDAEFGMHLAARQGIDDLQRQQLALDHQKQVAQDFELMQAGLLSADSRVPGFDAQWQDHAASMTGHFAPEQIKALDDLRSTKRIATQRFDSHVGALEALIDNFLLHAGEPGSLRRITREIESGMEAGLTLSERVTPGQRIQEGVDKLKPFLERFEKDIPQGVDPEGYKAEIRRAFHQMVERKLEGQLDETATEWLTAKTTELLGMAAPFGAAAKLGKLGAVGALTAYGALKPLDKSQREHVESLPEDQQKTAEIAHRAESAVHLGPLYLLWGLGGKLGATVGGQAARLGTSQASKRALQIGGSAAGMATVFPALGESIGIGIDQAKGGLGQLSPEIQKLIDTGVILRQDVAGPAQGMVESALARDLDGFLENAKHYGKEILPGLVAFTALNVLHSSDRSRWSPEDLHSRATRLEHEARAEVAEFKPEGVSGEQLTEMRQRMLNAISARAREMKQTPAQREEIRTRRELEEVTEGRASEAIEDRLTAEEFGGKTVEQRRQELEREQDRVEAKRDEALTDDAELSALRAESSTEALRYRDLARKARRRASKTGKPEDVAEADRLEDLSERWTDYRTNLAEWRGPEDGARPQPPRASEEAPLTPPIETRRVRRQIKHEQEAPRVAREIVEERRAESEAPRTATKDEVRPQHVGKPLVEIPSSSPLLDVSESGMRPSSLENARARLARGERDQPIEVFIQDGRVHVHDGRHRLRALQEQGRPVRAVIIETDGSVVVGKGGTLQAKPRQAESPRAESGMVIPRRSAAPERPMHRMQLQPERPVQGPISPTPGKGRPERAEAQQTLDRTAEALHPVLREIEAQEAPRDFLQAKAAELAGLSPIERRAHPWNGAAEALKATRSRDPHRLAAEFLWQRLHTAFGREAPGTSAAGEIKRLDRSLREASTPEQFELFLTEWRPHLEGPLSVVMRHFEPGLKAIRALEQRFVEHLQETGEAGFLYIPDVIALSGWVRGKVHDVARRAARGVVDRGEKQVEASTGRELTDPAFQERFDDIGSLDWRLANPIEWFRRIGLMVLRNPGMRIFESPISFGGKMAVDAGRAHAQAASELAKLERALLNKKSGLYRDVEEGSELAAQMGRAAHLGPESAEWQSLPPQHQQTLVARQAIMSELRQRAAFYSDAAKALRQEREFWEPIAQEQREKIAALESQLRTAEQTVRSSQSQRMLVRLRKEVASLTAKKTAATRRGEDAKARELERQINNRKADIRDFEKELGKELATQGVRHPKNVKASIKGAKKTLARHEEIIEQARRGEQEVIDSFGYENFLHHSPAVPLPKTIPGAKRAIARFFRPKADPRKAGAMKHRKGTLEAGENVEWDIKRADLIYLREILPYLHTERWAADWNKTLYGTWQRITSQEATAGIDTSIVRQEAFGSEIHYAGETWDHVLGRYARRENGSFVREDKLAEGESAGEAVVLLYRGKEKPKLNDPGWVEQKLEMKSLLEVPFFEATKTIRIKRGGFVRTADPFRAQQIKDYVATVSRVADEWGGKAELAKVDKFLSGFGHLGGWRSTLTLGAWNVFSAGRAMMGAFYHNIRSLGAVHGARSLRHVPGFVRWRRAVRGKGHVVGPAEDMLLVDLKYDPKLDRYVEQHRTGYEEKAYEAFEESGLGTSSRGFKPYLRRRSKHEPGQFLTQPNSKLDVARRWFRWAMEKSWSAFEVAEEMTRVTLFSEHYVLQRQAGRTHEQARDIAERLVTSEHAIMEEVMLPAALRSGIGKFLGGMQRWRLHWSGELQRLPPKEQARHLTGQAILAGTGALGGVHLLEIIGATLGDWPFGIGDLVENYIRDEDEEGLSEVLEEAFPAGTPVPDFVPPISGQGSDDVALLLEALGMYVANRDEKAYESLTELTKRYTIPSVVNALKRVFASWDDEATGQRLYSPPFSDKPRPVMSQSDSAAQRAVAEVFPPIEAKTSQFQADLQYLRRKEAEGERESFRRQAVRLMRRYIRWEQAGKPQGEEREDIDAEIKAMAERAPEGVVVNRRYFQEAYQQAQLELHGNTPFFRSLKAGSKSDKARALANALENDRSLTAETIRFALQMVAGKQSFGAWVNDERISPTLRQRIGDGLSKHGLQ